MLRFQTKDSPTKDWNEKGPDLLRTRKNARRRIKDDLAEHGGNWYVRIKVGQNPWKAWTGPHDRSEILEAFDDWSPKDGTLAQWGRKIDGGKVEAKGAVRVVVVDVVHRSGCTDETDKVVALMEAGFPPGVYGGTFVCKTVSGSSTYSQHAYGAAYDHSAYEKNDEATDWTLRMVRENREDDIVLPVWQVLGSKNGNAGNASNGDGDWIGDFPWTAGGVDSSHEWHVHVSTGKKKKSGTPSCASKSLAVDEPVEEHDGTDAEEE